MCHWLLSRLLCPLLCSLLSPVTTAPGRAWGPSPSSCPIWTQLRKSGLPHDIVMSKIHWHVQSQNWTRQCNEQKFIVGEPTLAQLCEAKTRPPEPNHAQSEAKTRPPKPNHTRYEANTRLPEPNLPVKIQWTRIRSHGRNSFVFLGANAFNRYKLKQLEQTGHACLEGHPTEKKVLRRDLIECSRSCLKSTSLSLLKCQAPQWDFDERCIVNKMHAW